MPSSMTQSGCGGRARSRCCRFFLPLPGRRDGFVDALYPYDVPGPQSAEVWPGAGTAAGGTAGPPLACR
jgi:hypothetical protein